MSYGIFCLGFLQQLKGDDTSRVVKNLLNLMCADGVKKIPKARFLCVFYQRRLNF